MNFDQFVKDLLQYDADHMIIDKNQQILIWNRIIGGLDFNESVNENSHGGNP